LRTPFYSLRTGILSLLAILIISAMLLINVVIVKFAERDLLHAKLSTGQLLLHTLEHRAVYEITSKNKKWADLRSDPWFKRDILQVLRAGGYTDILMVDNDGTKVFGTDSSDVRAKKAISISRESLLTRKWAFDYYGSTWGVIWLAHKKICMSIPILSNDRLMGAITIWADLVPLYQTLRKSERIILIYILLNTIILLLFGNHLLSRTVIKPVHRLLKITEEFKEGEFLPQSATSGRNEIGRLFRSLNMMLKRLEENKQELKEHISSLEKANQDIKKAQDETIKAEKLASVGRLATGVAHEIGNPIGIILGYLDLLKGTDLGLEERKDFLDRIESEITRISQIIRQLLDFSRPSSGQPVETSIHELVMETVDMLRPHPMMADIDIEWILDADTDITWTDPNQLKQVFLNIILNAADAMGNEGDADDEGDKKTLTIKSLNRKAFIEILFIDTGPGIPDEELRHIFDPFFTTKEPGKGTGLGLSISYRIIEALGGTISAESTPYKGTRIIIDIPLHKMEHTT